MIIKLPAVYDVSHHKEIFDFKKVDPKPVLFITKATEDVAFVDDKFERFFEGMMEIEVVRGAYHFHRKAYNPYRQAEHFIKIISRMDIRTSDFLILDVEEGGERAAQMWAWFKTVRDAFPNNRQLLYSRKNLLDPIYMTNGEKEFFRQIPTWPAGYPYFPDLFSKIPSGYIPDQTKYGPPGLWQYTSHGRVSGITTPLGNPTDVDLNWIDPTFYMTLGSNKLGEVVMANQIWEVTSDTPAKVWSSIGGPRTYPDLSKGTRVITDYFQNEYLHFIGTRSGFSKKEWFKYIQDVNTEPPPPPPPPSEEYILHVKDGVTRKFIPE